MQLKKGLCLAVHSPCSLKLPLLSTPHIWVGLDFGGCGGKDAVKSMAVTLEHEANGQPPDFLCRAHCTVLCMQAGSLLALQTCQL